MSIGGAAGGLARNKKNSSLMLIRGVRGYAAQAILQINAEIAEKGHLWMGTD